MLFLNFNNTLRTFDTKNIGSPMRKYQIYINTIGGNFLRYQRQRHRGMVLRRSRYIHNLLKA